MNSKWREFLLAWLIPLAAGVGIVGGLFVLVVFLCCVFGGYDLKMLFGG